MELAPRHVTHAAPARRSILPVQKVWNKSGLVGSAAERASDGSDDRINTR
ncbi:msl8613 [Mesorhizobium japonicum MAFF 303099]|uniref:Msl8613 protein n=1 Tax=Mesorhizobium japonicum (strain LMG 29417 / CECT 9101 / MAFF 303099) TaxID=266835 RepID=Q98J53_RHILO|nr:msl8613 [Mesorhizobium japonicum MAFF 303099]